MVYDDIQKKWVPSGSSSGLSKVQIYHHQQNNTFRVVGRKLQDHEVVINCSILKGLKYNQATATFHQWRDSKFVYGLNFSSQQDAEAFARAMMHALEVLSGRVIPQSMPPPQQQNNTNYEEDMGYRTMTREEATILQSQQQMTTVDGRTVQAPQTPTSQNSQNTPQSPPTPQGHHRTSSAPPAPQPPPMSMPMQNYPQQNNVALPPQQSQQQMSGGPVPPYQTQSSYTSQSSQNSYGSNQNVAQQQFPNQPIYVASNSSQSLNQQLQQQLSQNNGPIYVASSASSTGIPTSASNNSVGVYGQQMAMPPAPPGPFSQTNGNAGYGNPSQFIQQPVPPQPPILPNQSMSSNGPPQAPPPPPSAFGGMGGPPANVFNSAPPQPPAPPSAAPPPPSGPGIGAPPPPPPPPMGGPPSSNDGPDMNSLAAQLKQAQLKRNQKTTPPPPAENSGSSTSSGGSGNYGTIGRTSTGMASMMDEMAKTLARRRAQVEKKEVSKSFLHIIVISNKTNMLSISQPEQPSTNDNDISNTRTRPWEKSNTLPHKLGSANNSTSNNQLNTSSSQSGIGAINTVSHVIFYSICQ